MGSDLNYPKTKLFYITPDLFNEGSLTSIAAFLKEYFCVFLYQYWPGGFMLFVVLCPGTPEGFLWLSLGRNQYRREGL